MNESKEEYTKALEGFVNEFRKLLEELIDLGNITEDDVRGVKGSNEADDK